MKRLLLMAFLLLPGAQCARWQTYADRFGFTPKVLKEPPTSYRMTGAVLDDVRNRRQLEEHLDEGRPTCDAIIYRDNNPTCAKDETTFEEYPFPNKAPFDPHPIEERAFYCRQESVYYYNYKGGPYRRDLWFGPYTLKRTRPDPDP